MSVTTTESQLQQLKVGDRLKYHGVQWQVADFSTYADSNDYETAEWLLRSNTGKEYYLMREVDPNHPEALVHWYLAEQLRNPMIYEPGGTRDLTVSLAQEMRSHNPPYPALQVFNRVYQFESQTEGFHESNEGTDSRITWDYWDAPHLWNLALEAWSHGRLVVYSTRMVQPVDFTDIQSGGGLEASGWGERSPVRLSLAATGRSPKPSSSRSIELVLAWFLMILGFILFLSGV